jgi:SWI/SNF-related matrix-associated actin-dependent regulator of chromatin subfamily A member 5
MTDQNDVDSDIELVGVDMDDDDEVPVDSTDDIIHNEQDRAFEKEEEGIDDELAIQEASELEAARKERLELIKAEQEALKIREKEAKDPQSRLDYLLHQSDVFAHFLAGSVASTNSKRKKGKGTTTATSTKGARGGERLTEEEEDELLLKSAQSQRHSVVRLDHQPSILAPICKMHPYQLEGLNWMIKLHDHGINAILADGKRI